MIIHTHDNLKNYSYHYRLWDKPPEKIENQLRNFNEQIKLKKIQTWEDKNWPALIALGEIQILIKRGEISLHKIDESIKWAMKNKQENFEVKPLKLEGKLAKLLKAFRNRANGFGDISKLDEISVMAIQSFIDYFQGGLIVRDKCESNGRPIPYKYCLKDARIDEKHINMLVYRLKQISYNESCLTRKFRINKILKSIDLTSNQFRLL